MRKIIKNISIALFIVVGITIFTAMPVFASQEGWIKNSDGTWSYYHNGNLYKNTWLHLNRQNWYFFKEDGTMATGWIKDSSYWYYLYSDGSMASNTVIDGYKLNSSGQWIDDTPMVVVESKKTDQEEDIAPGHGMMLINYDNVQIFRNNTSIEIWVRNCEGSWVVGQCLNTVPAKEEGKDDDLQNGMPKSLTYTINSCTTLQLPPQGHEYIIAIKWKARYRGVKVEVYKDNFSENKENELLITKDI